MLDVVLLVAAWLIGLLLLMFWRRQTLSRQSRERVYQSPALLGADSVEDDLGTLDGWLFRAGFRSPGASATFITLTLLGVEVGGAATAAILLGNSVREGVRTLELIPGGVGELFIPLLYVAPWTLAIGIPCLPWVYVRSARRRRVARFEEDLPLSLDLLATLAEAGLGFDAGLERVLEALAVARPLAQELRAFQTEVLGGRGRVRSLRRLGRRVDLVPFTVFISALVQTEQTGGAFSFDRRCRRATGCCWPTAPRFTPVSCASRSTS